MNECRSGNCGSRASTDEGYCQRCWDEWVDGTHVPVSGVLAATTLAAFCLVLIAAVFFREPNRARAIQMPHPWPPAAESGR
jgi:hypothetical protein